MEKLEEVKKALDAIGVRGMTVTHVRGRGKQRGVAQQWRGLQYRIDLLPKVKLEIVIDARKVDKITNTILKSARTGNIGDGKIFIMSIEEVMRVRTGERGKDAI